MMQSEDKPDPDELLKGIQKEEDEKGLGRLKIFFGMAAGVGKTYAMLQAAQQLFKGGVNVVVGTINTHGRKETEEVLKGLPRVPEKWIKYKEIAFEEFDLEAILDMKPQVVLIDELAHSNVPGSKHSKRWQDVIEILNAGIDVYTTLNVQHVESRKDLVEKMTGIQVHESVPDLILERGHSIELIDITPQDLLQRLREGKVYLGEQSKRAAENFFLDENLMALREIALRFTAEKVDHDLHSILHGKGWKTRERLMVAVSSSPSSEQLIRSARRFAFEIDAPLIAVFVDTGHALNDEDQSRLSRHFILARDLGAEVITTHDLDVVTGLERIANQRDITRIVIGRSPKQKFSFFNFIHGTFIERLENNNKNIDILILRQEKVTQIYQRSVPVFKLKSQLKDYWVSIISVVGITLIGFLAGFFTGYKSIGFIYLLGILALSFFVGRGPILFAAALSALIWDFLFIPPVFTLTISDPEDISFVVVYFLLAALAGTMTSRMREQERFLQAREEISERLYEIEREIANALNFQYLRVNVCSRLESFFSGKFDILVKSPENEIIIDSVLPFVKEEKEKVAIQWVFKNGKIAGWSTDTLPLSAGLYFPIKLFQTTNGILVYQPRKRSLSMDEMNFIQTVAQQLGVYLERYVFEERVNRLNESRQLERMHKSLFSSVNQSLYEPLDRLSQINKQIKECLKLEEKPLLDQMDQLTSTIKFTVDNVIAVSEIQSGLIGFDSKRNSINDLLEKCRVDMEPFLLGRMLEIEYTNPPLFFNFDFKLLKLAIENIILNAIVYSPSSSLITINMKRTEKEFLISVIDEGVGIEEKVFPQIFDKFYHDEEVSTGLGLGLFIVKSVVDIHKGRLTVQKREGNIGTDFTIILPN